MIKKVTVVVALVMFAMSTAAYAQNTSIGVRGSTLGIGVEGERTLTDSLGIRGGVNYFTYSYSGAEADIEYDFDLDLMSAPILVDWHPFKGSFRISGGVLLNGNEINATAKPIGSFDIGDGTYIPTTDIDTLKGKIDFNAVAPYLAFGWDTCFGKESGFGFVFELGAVYQGTPEADLSVTGPIASDSMFQSNLAAEEADLQDALDNFKIYPVVSVGISYRF